jgi:hypothetical protein
MKTLTVRLLEALAADIDAESRTRRCSRSESSGNALPS